MSDSHSTNRSHRRKVGGTAKGAKEHAKRVKRRKGEPYTVLLACGHTIYRSIQGGRVAPSYWCAKDRSDEVVLRYNRLEG